MAVATALCDGLCSESAGVAGTLGTLNFGELSEISWMVMLGEVPPPSGVEFPPLASAATPVAAAAAAALSVGSLPKR